MNRLLLWLGPHWSGATFSSVMTSFATRVAIYVPFSALIGLIVIPGVISWSSTCVFCVLKLRVSFLWISNVRCILISSLSVVIAIMVPSLNVIIRVSKLLSFSGSVIIIWWRWCRVSTSASRLLTVPITASTSRSKIRIFPTSRSRIILICTVLASIGLLKSNSVFRS